MNQNQKDSAKVTLLVVLVVVLAVVLVYFTFLKKSGEVAVSPTLTTTPTVTVNPTANWKTYTNNQYGYEFKYPSNYSVSTTGSTNIAPLVSSPYVSIEVGNYQTSNLTGGKPITVGGMAAIKYPVGGNMDGGVEYQIDVPSKKLTIFFGGINSSSYNYISEYDKIISTFKFTICPPAPSCKFSVVFGDPPMFSNGCTNYACPETPVPCGTLPPCQSPLIMKLPDPRPGLPVSCLADYATCVLP